MKKEFKHDELSILIKFGSKENLESLQKGYFYAKRLQHFIDLEKDNFEAGNGQGDMYEGQFVQKNVIVELRDPDTKELFARTNADLAVTDFGYRKYPVFCMFSLDCRNHMEEKIIGTKLIESYRFTDEQISKMFTDFGEYALMISNAEEFILRVKNGLKAKGITQYSKGLVQYYKPDDFSYIKDISNNLLWAAFWKRESYAFQQEFRILVPQKVDDHLQIDIGDISDISQLIKAEELLHSQIDIIFDIQNGGDPHA